MRRFLPAALLTAMLAVGMLAAAPTTQALPLPQAATCGGVWVVVDYGSLGGISTHCATSYSNGTGALRSAGFGPVLDNGMIVKIGGKPATVNTNESYWSYWHATRKSDGSYSGWSYSNLGGNAYHPTKGNAEGWRYQSTSGGKVAPGAAPPKNPVAKPTPTRTSTKPSSKPTVKATPTTKASATRSATATARATKATTVPTATPSPTPTASVEPTATESETEVTEPSPPTDPGSPVGAIAAGSLVTAGAAGVGAWWLLKGRRR
ncbi:MAG: hypothetical protein IT193_08900 [Propionibacteriaceae bacterium]|nr:hypothetical protein [Propionibacteriaceae bacterium]